MTVKELIEILKTCDENANVVIEQWDGDTFGILTCLTGFEVHDQAACVKPENFDLNVGANYARIKAEDKIWEGLGFVLQWAKYGLKK
jgi:hypothetical protein